MTLTCPIAGCGKSFSRKYNYDQHLLPEKKCGIKLRLADLEKDNLKLNNLYNELKKELERFKKESLERENKLVNEIVGLETEIINLKESHKDIIASLTESHAKDYKELCKEKVTSRSYSISNSSFVVNNNTISITPYSPSFMSKLDDQQYVEVGRLIAEQGLAQAFIPSFMKVFETINPPNIFICDKNRGKAKVYDGSTWKLIEAKTLVDNSRQSYKRLAPTALTKFIENIDICEEGADEIKISAEKERKILRARVSNEYIKFTDDINRASLAGTLASYIKDKEPEGMEELVKETSNKKIIEVPQLIS